MAGMSGNCESGYKFEIDAYVCIGSNGNLEVFWNKFDCNDYVRVIRELAWDGSAVSATFNDEDFCIWSGTDVGTNITVTATRSGPNTVTIAWTADTTANCHPCLKSVSPVGDSFDVTIDSGTTCSVPSDASDPACPH